VGSEMAYKMLMKYHRRLNAIDIKAAKVRCATHCHAIFCILHERIHTSHDHYFQCNATRQLTDLEKVFELNISKHRELKKTRQENRLLKQLWDMITIVEHQFDSWRRMLWDDIDVDMLIVQTKNLQLQIRNMNKEMFGWPAYLSLVDEVKNMLTVLPLVSLLRRWCSCSCHVYF
jgi:hypothetical protein